MELIRITNSSDPILADVPNLYELAFPPVARIPSERLRVLETADAEQATKGRAGELSSGKRLLRLIDKFPQMTFNVIVGRTSELCVTERVFHGMAVVWNLGSFSYLEYFAILPASRCQGIGSEVLRTLRAQTTCPIVAEVEPPETDIQKRRIGFYRRNGFHVVTETPTILNDFHTGNPLWLLASQPLEDVNACQREIIRSVYQRMYNST